MKTIFMLLAVYFLCGEKMVIAQDTTSSVDEKFTLTYFSYNQKIPDIEPIKVLRSFWEKRQKKFRYSTLVGGNLLEYYKKNIELKQSSLPSGASFRIYVFKINNIFSTNLSDYKNLVEQTSQEVCGKSCGIIPSFTDIIRVWNAEKEDLAKLSDHQILIYTFNEKENLPKYFEYPEVDDSTYTTPLLVGQHYAEGTEWSIDIIPQYDPGEELTYFIYKNVSNYFMFLLPTDN